MTPKPKWVRCHSCKAPIMLPQMLCDSCEDIITGRCVVRPTGPGRKLSERERQGREG